MRNKALRDPIIIAAISLGLLVVSETILRIVFPERIATRPASGAYEFNEDYLISLAPNIQKTFVRAEHDGGDTIQWKTNNDGFRGDPLRNNPQVRIMVYGDSNVQARFSKTENTFAYKVGEYLKHKGIKGIEVVNAGTLGFGPDQSLIRFEKDLDIYKPDLVIFHVFADNDFGDIVRNRLFELDANGDLVETEYERTVDQALVPDDVRSLISKLLIVRATQELVRLMTGSADIDKKEETYNTLQSATNREYSVYKESQPREFSHFADHYDIDVALDPDAESSKTKIGLMEAILRRSNIISASKGVEFLVVIQPSVMDLTRHNAVLNYEYLQKKSSKYRRTNLTDALENICIGNNIHFVNLFDVFMRNDPDTLFFLDDDHWTDQGQDIAAKETVSFITSQMLE